MNQHRLFNVILSATYMVAFLMVLLDVFFLGVNHGSAT